MSVNLSRVRPAWRCWYRGEPFGELYKSSTGGFRNEQNRSYNWMRLGKYYSMVSFVEDQYGLGLEDVKRIAPEWYIEQLNRYAKPLTQEFLAGLPGVIKEELKNPRYNLIYEDGKIIGRYPDL